MITDLLRETCEIRNVRITDDCMMLNHYHIRIQIPENWPIKKKKSKMQKRIKNGLDRFRFLYNNFLRKVMT